MYRAAVFATTFAGSLGGHETGDYLVQRDCDAQRKQQGTAVGRRALAVHAASYAATQHLTKRLAYRAAGLRVPAVANLAGSLAEGLVHAAIDDGRVLRWFADVTGKRGFHDVAGNGINGRALMDQAAHKGLQIPVGAAVTAAVAAATGGGCR